MDEAELYAQLSVLLAEELGERIPDLTSVLLSLERAPTEAELARELHRLIHVVKGASRSAGILTLETACHELETELAAVSVGAAVPAETIALGVRFVDQLESARQQLLAAEPVTVALGAPSPAAVDTSMPDRNDAHVRVGAIDLDILMSRSAAVLMGRQRLADPISKLNELRADLEHLTRASTDTQLAKVARSLANIQRSLTMGLVSLGAATSQLDEQVRRMRLRSVADMCRGYDRVVHDLALAMGKSADLVIRGAEVRLDRAHVEVLRDVIIQLLRNAVVHGLESPPVRSREGKPARGQISIGAQTLGDSVQISIADDGGGLDFDAIARASAQGGLRASTKAELSRAIFAPGLSTATTITELAGRGVGLDVARQRIEALHGSIGVDSIPGKSTTFTIELPTTVATILGLVVTLDGTPYVIPATSVERVLSTDAAAIRHADGRSFIRISESWIPLGALSALFRRASPPGATRKRPTVVLSHAGGRAAVIVDRILELSELAVGALDPRLGRIRHVVGQARLPDGTIALVLNATDLIEDSADAGLPMITVEPVAPKKRHILVVDDSATTRALETSILRSAGYEVTAAVDGEDALRQLSERETLDAIVADVDMPNLDGFGLTEAVRALQRFASVPIILVTARGTDSDRARGLRAGASAYLVKSSFDQSVLLQSIARLL